MLNAADLRRRREELALTQEELARRCVVSLTTIQAWESGVTPHPRNQRRLAAVLEGPAPESDLAALGRQRRDILVSTAVDMSNEIHYRLHDIFLSDLGALPEADYVKLVALVAAWDASLQFVEPDGPGDEREAAAGRAALAALQALPQRFDPDYSRRNAEYNRRKRERESELQVADPDRATLLRHRDVLRYMTAWRRSKTRKGCKSPEQRYGAEAVAEVNELSASHPEGAEALLRDLEERLGLRRPAQDPPTPFKAVKSQTSARSSKKARPQRGRSRAAKTAPSRAKGSRRGRANKDPGSSEDDGSSDPPPSVAQAEVCP